MVEKTLNKLGLTRKSKSIPSINFPYRKGMTIQQTKFDFWIVDETGEQWYDHNFWDGAVEMQQLKQLLNPSDHVLEIGVHQGFTACYISKNLNSNGKFIGIELSPKSALYAQAQLKLNNFGTNCQIINAAASDKEGVISFNNVENGNAMINKNNSSYSIKSVTGDSILKELDHVNLLKIDVEGFELNVLKGCKTILSSLPKIALEIHLDSIAQYQASVNDIFNLIPLEKYSGKYFWNPGTQYIRPDTHKLLDFEIDKLPASGIINLFLTPIINNH